MNRKLVPLLLVLFALPLFGGHRFHASALAVGGDGVPGVGSLSLAPTGGEGTSVVRDYDDGFVRFAEATTVVRGTREGSTSITASVVTIRDLEIGGRIHAGVVIARVNERHEANTPEAEITFEGSTIENLAIDGIAVPVTLDHDYFAQRPTFATMRTAGISTSRSGAILCSARRPAACGAVHDAAWSIAVPGLGQLIIGEVLVTDGHREINMLRLEREARREGGPRRIVAHDGGGSKSKSTVVGSATGNGTDFGPP